MRYRLRTLLIVLALVPMLFAVLWPVDSTRHKEKVRPVPGEKDYQFPPKQINNR